MVSYAPFVFLSVILLLSFVYLASRISQFGLAQLRKKSVALSQPSAGLRWVPDSFKRQRRAILWISLEELKSLLDRDPDDLIVLDLRFEAEWMPPFPLPKAMVLPVTPSELTEILGWLPSKRSLVFYGSCAHWIPAIEECPSIQGEAPFYLLDDRPSFLEVA